MKVSVIVAAYNIEDYIERCIQSILNQILKEIEIIIVNDGSTDKTLDIIKDISLSDERIRLINQKNKGLIEARKSGLKYANGEYILFVDGDDWLEVDALSKLYYKALEFSSDIVLYNVYWSYDNKRIPKSTFDTKQINKSPIIDSLLLGTISPVIWNKLIKREFIIKNNVEFPTGISFAEDLATTASLLLNNPTTSFLNEYLYNYYQRDNSITKSLDKRVLEVDNAIEFIKQQMIKKDRYTNYIDYFEYMVYCHIFETKFLVYNERDYIHKTLYKQYRNRLVKIYKNKYIRRRIKTYPLSLKIRAYAYLRDYKYGIIYDQFRMFFIKRG